MLGETDGTNRCKGDPAMTEKKRETKPGQENLDENIYGPKPTPISSGTWSPPSLPLSRKTSSTTSSTVVWKVTSIKLPEAVLFQAKRRCLELGLHLQDILAILVERWLEVDILLPEHRRNPPGAPKPSRQPLRTEIGDLQVKKQLQIIEGLRKRGAKPALIEEFQEELAKIVKKTKISPEMEQQVRKELNLA
jgi:hypothetical protein